jgi:hypothetical protein
VMLCAAGADGSCLGRLCHHVLAHHAPDGQLVHVHLVPVVRLHCGRQRLPLVLPDAHVADLGELLVLSEADHQPAVRQLVALQDDAQAVAALLELLAGSRPAERQIVVAVRLLRVVVRADLVEPERHLVALLILSTAACERREGETDTQRERETSQCMRAAELIRGWWGPLV